MQRAAVPESHVSGLDLCALRISLHVEKEINGIRHDNRVQKEWLGKTLDGVNREYHFFLYAGIT